MARMGGVYTTTKGKSPNRTGGTEPHPQGNRARDADGTALRDTGRVITVTVPEGGRFGAVEGTAAGAAPDEKE